MAAAPAKCYYIGVLRVDVPSETADRARGRGTGQATTLCEAKDTSSLGFLASRQADSFIPVIAPSFVADTLSGERKMEDTTQGLRVHVYRPAGFDICAITLTDKTCEAKSGQFQLGRMVDEFKNTFRMKILDKSPPPYDFKDRLLFYMNEIRKNERSAIEKAQDELNETKIIMQNTIQSMMERGEKLDSLVAKSDQLGIQSKMFYTASKKQNSCCVVM